MLLGIILQTKQSVGDLVNITQATFTSMVTNLGWVHVIFLSPPQGKIEPLTTVSAGEHVSKCATMDPLQNINKLCHYRQPGSKGKKSLLDL